MGVSESGPGQPSVETAQNQSISTLAHPNSRVLVADDDPTMGELVSRIIASEIHCETETVLSGDAALERLGQRHYDLLVTDMVMPGLHGFELLERLRKGWPSLPTMVMTGFAHDFPYTEAIMAGAADFICKPFPPLELAAKVARILREREILCDLRNTERQYRNLFDRATEGMVLVGDTSYKLRDANHAFERLCGRTRAELAGQPIAEVFTGDDRDRVTHWLELCQRKGAGAISDLALPKEGGTRYVDLTASFIDSAGERLIFLIVKDITARREFEHEMADTAQRDELTGLYNKRGFQSRLAFAMRQSAMTKTPLSLLMIDLDNFKACNDTYGHTAGDQVLAATGQVLRAAAHRTLTDTGFRFGGDEFGLILQDTNGEGAACVARRVQESFSKVERRGTSMSIGVAEYIFGMSEEEFVEAVDGALYKAKDQGKNCIAMA